MGITEKYGGTFWGEGNLLCVNKGQVTQMQWCVEHGPMIVCITSRLHVQ